MSELRAFTVVVPVTVEARTAEDAEAVAQNEIVAVALREIKREGADRGVTPQGAVTGIGPVQAGAVDVGPSENYLAEEELPTAAVN